MKLLKLVFWIIPKSLKKKIFPVFIFNLVSIILEIISIGMIFPLLIFLTDQKSKFFGEFSFINLENYDQKNLILFSSLLILFIFIIKNIFLSITLKKNAEFIFNNIKDLSNFLFENYLKKNFIFFTNVNSSVLIRNVIQDVNTFSVSILFPIITILVESVLLITLSIGLMFVVGFKVVIFALIPTILISLIIYSILKNRLSHWGQIAHQYVQKKIQNTKQGFEGIREIILNNAHKEFLMVFTRDNEILINSDIKKWFYLNISRYGIEALVIITFVIIIFLLNNLEYSPNEILSTLGIFAGVAFRSMPSFVRISNAINSIKFSIPILDNLKKEIQSLNDQIIYEKKLPNIKYSLSQKIYFNQVCFSYGSEDKKIFQNLSFQINKNDKVGIFGPSGCGKSTFIDLLSGLIIPNSGEIKSDNININNNVKNWQKLISYVSQKNYIIDGTIKENITLKFSEKNGDVDDNKIKEILKIVDLYEFCMSLDKNLDHSIGEYGTKLSGGQIQRISIARAIYSKPKLLILDESTNALDLHTEKKLLQNLFNYSEIQNIVFISHKIESLKYCNKIFELKNKNFIEKKYE